MLFNSLFQIKIKIESCLYCIDIIATLEVQQLYEQNAYFLQMAAGGEKNIESK